MKTLKIYRDDCPENPRTFSEHSSKMAYKHSKYTLGDESIHEPIEWLESKLNTPQQGEYTRQRLESLEARFFKEFIALPLYIYDHSGVTMQTTPFSCSWDSSKVGYIYISTQDVRNEWGVKRVSLKLRQRILDNLRGQVEEFDSYLRGDVFWFEVLDENNDEIDSCGGFYGRDFKTNGITSHLNSQDFGIDNEEDFVKFISSIEISE